MADTNSTTDTRAIAAPVRAALVELFDYAGLFPPAKLSMEEAVAAYARHRSSPWSWMLRRFVCPASRLDELVDAMSAARVDGPWPLSVLSHDWCEQRAAAAAFAAKHPDTIRITSVEQPWRDKLPSASEVSVYVEVSLKESLTLQAETIRGSGCYAKIRTGGLEPDCFPSAEQIGAFLDTVASPPLAFKATAGLHHPFPTQRPASATPGAPILQMHGFVNVLLSAATIEREHVDRDRIEKLLSTTDPPAFSVGSDSIQVGEHVIFVDAIQTSRYWFQAIGTCSFDEPVADLQGFGWLTAQAAS